ncbi:serine/threonine-protein kinase [Chroococcidiopsis sp. CCNUC1]|uniref:serine/threonine-protein kinase n=1 Tax=Chroococcidiopsis sp. CCNUC1 TaxID=2653189 RepID=UPI00201FFFE7|nr:serine/threonine-protein kinase [Chroococcidiopsis sp. CCNUC1]URD48376.1 tetratricopeptide repeat protein [Chroococcidiopsis sp. CCNUC1]
MSYCINPYCRNRINCDDLEQCQYCGTQLLVNGQFRLLMPLRPLDTDSSTEVFEVVDEQGTWVDPPGTHKVMKILSSTNSKLIELMEREANVLSLVDSPGIPRVDVDGYFTFQPNGNAPQLHCLVMEKIPGHNLNDWIELHGKISQVLALDWLKQIVEILGNLHSYGFFHRDIKPTNIILKPDGQLALIDFGAVRETTNTYMAKVSRGLISTTDVGGFYNVTAIGTACYTPIEQLNGKAVPQSDFYALGRTFVYLLTGIPLLDIPSDPKTGQLMWRKLAAQIDEPFADFIDELMAHLPGKRPQNTQIILQQLDRLPFKSKLNRLVKSKPFRFGAIALSLFLAFGVYKISLPAIVNSLLEQGKKAQRENRLSDARQNFDLAIWLKPNTADSVSSFYFEQASRHQNNPAIAKKNYELAIKYNPHDVDAYNNLALTCQQMNDYRCVADNYQKAFQLKPNNWEGHYGLGSFYDDRGKYDLAEQQYKLAIGIDRDRAVGAINNLSRLGNLNGEYDAAIKLAQEGLSKTQVPDSQAALYKNLGWAKFGQKRYLAAKNHLQKSLQLDPQRVDAYCLLAQTQEALGESAKLSWEVCLLASSDLPEVQEWRQQILQRLWQR